MFGPNEDGGYLCDMSDSEGVRDPDDLRVRRGSLHRATKVSRGGNVVKLHNMKIEKLLFHKDEFLDFWTTKCWLKTSQSSEKPLDSNGNCMYWLTF